MKPLLSLNQNLFAAVTANRLRIILGSASPRRREALAIVLGDEKLFEIKVSDFHEELSHALYPTAIEYCMATAQEKAKELCLKLREASCKTLIITADTVVALGDQILEKPTSAEDAKRMLRLLSGKEHAVHTSVVLYELPETIEGFSFTTTTKVKFAELSDEEIAAYVATGEPMDKAGSYGAQDKGRLLIEWINGDFYNVVGFPAREFALRFADYLENTLMALAKLNK